MTGSSLRDDRPPPHRESLATSLTILSPQRPEDPAASRPLTPAALCSPVGPPRYGGALLPSRHRRHQCSGGDGYWTSQLAAFDAELGPRCDCREGPPCPRAIVVDEPDNVVWSATFDIGDTGTSLTHRPLVGGIIGATFSDMDTTGPVPRLSALRRRLRWATTRRSRTRVGRVAC